MKGGAGHNKIGRRPQFPSNTKSLLIRARASDSLFYPIIPRLMDLEPLMTPPLALLPRIAFVLIATLPLSFALTPAALAVEPAQISTDEARVRSIWTRYSVPAPTQDQLMTRLKQGQQTDADSGASPTTTEHSDEGAMSVTVQRFNDGSISVSRTTNPKARTSGITANSVSQCKGSSGGDYVKYYNGCLAEQWTASVSWAMRFNYRVVYGAAYVGSHWDEQYSCFLCTFGSQKIYKRTASSIRWKGTVTYSLTGSSFSRWMDVNTSPSGASTSAN